MVNNGNERVFSPSPTRRDYILSNKIMKEYLACRSRDFKLGFGSPDPLSPNLFEGINEFGPFLLDFVGRHGLEIYYECRLMYKSTKKRIKTCKKKIGNMVTSGDCYFVTLTFKNDAFAKSTLEQRRRWVRRWFKEQCVYYVANIDFGDEKGREHYHGVIRCNEIPKKEWKHGFINIKKIGNSEKDQTKISKYINKLTAHSLKASTGNAYRVIYSRRHDWRTLLKTSD